MLNRLILANLPKEMRHQYPLGTIMIVRKPLYGIPEAGTHWWATYYKHHKEKLFIVTLLYNPCLLITTKKEAFKVVSMQTNDTLFLASKEFAALKDNKLQKAYLTTKLKDELFTIFNLIFNRCVVTMNLDSTIHLIQKD